MEQIICQICNESKQSHRHLISHLQKHKITYSDYKKRFNIVEQTTNCKTCNVEISIKKQYCSNRCKFADTELNKTRTTKEYKFDSSTQELVCNYCGYKSADVNGHSGHAKKHLRISHGILDNNLLSHYTIVDKMIKPVLQCPKCNWSTIDIENKSGTFTTHLKKQHNITPEEYCAEYPESKPLWKIYFKQKDRESFILANSKNRIRCEECGEYFQKLSNSHLKKHGLTPEQYKQKYNVYKTTSDNVSEIQSRYTTTRNLEIGTAFSKNNRSSYEDQLKDRLRLYNIAFISPFLYAGKLYDFYIPAINCVIEIDGDGHHKVNLERLTVQTINSACNDYVKNKIMDSSPFKFYRIRFDSSKLQFTTETELLDNVIDMMYTPDYSISYEQIIVFKEYFENYINVKGKDKLNRYVPLFLKFLRTFHPQFPYPNNQESLVDIQNTIKSKISIIDSGIVNNNTSNAGVAYLKSNFKSYWHSRYDSNTKSPYDVWFDDTFMQKVIQYRIGCNNSNEIFDFSLHQMIRGISAYRHTISFFKPVVAASIYKHFLGDTDRPIVIDPCAGFGGRLLGFKSIYPNGTYIGIEPNIDTYNELSELAKNFTNVELHNCKLEDYNGSKDCDLTFTSIPYFDTEIYSNHISYDSIDVWQQEFINGLLTYKNLVVNIAPEIEHLFPTPTTKFYLQNQTSHFNKNSKNKLEPILIYK